MDPAALRENAARVREAVDRAVARSVRPGRSVRLVAVTKGHPLATLEAALEAGLRDLAENRVEELVEKAAALGPDRGVTWHMVGHIQSRKAARVAGVAHVIHSVDSVRLAEKLSRALAEAGRELPVLVQVNTSGEETKGGFGEAEALTAIGTVVALPGLRVEGLMTMAPLTDDETVLRSTFRRVREIQIEASRRLPEYRGGELSMGMTNDYEIAVEEGSTMVRVGTALFGERPQ